MKRKEDPEDQLFVNMPRENAVTGKQKDLIQMAKGRNNSEIQKNKFLIQEKQHKPGRDLYSLIALSQFLILLFTILFFTSVERDYSNTLPSNHTLEQFSSGTIITVFIIILVISADRHIYLTKKFDIIKEDKEKEEVEDEDLGEFKYV